MSETTATPELPGDEPQSEQAEAVAGAPVGFTAATNECSSSKWSCPSS